MIFVKKKLAFALHIFLSKFLDVGNYPHTIKTHNFLNIKKEYFLKIIILLLFLFFLTGCEPNKVSTVPEKKIIGVSMASMEEDVFQIMKEAMFDMKDKDNVEIIWLNAENKENKEKENIDYLLKKNVDVIIINAVNSKESKKSVNKIREAEIPVVALDRIVRDVKLSAYITTDSFTVGKKQAKYLAENIDKEGKILILKGDKNDNVSFEITAGNKEIFKKNLKIDIVAENWHKNWSPELAEKTVRKILKEHPDIKGILANNSNMAMAAVKVLKEEKLIDKVITVGADANKEACLAIAKNEHNADIDKMPHILGLTAYKVAVMITRGEEWNYEKHIKNGEHEVPVTVTPVMLINKYNLINMRDRWTELNEYIKTVK